MIPLPYSPIGVKIDKFEKGTHKKMVRLKTNGKAGILKFSFCHGVNFNFIPFDDRQL